MPRDSTTFKYKIRNSCVDEEKFSQVEKKRPNALEMAKKAHEEREKAKKAAQNNLNKKFH